MKRIVWGIVIALVTLLSAVGGVAWWKYQQILRFAAIPVAPTAAAWVEIPRGLAPRQILERLASAGAVSDAQQAWIYARYLKKVAGGFRAGEYFVDPAVPQTPEQVLARLLKGERRQVRVTIPEGLRLEEQAVLVAAAGFGTAEAFIAAARDPVLAKTLEIPAPTLEGYLFPDTYSLNPDTSARDVAVAMVERFRQAWGRADAQRSPAVTLDRHQAVTLASIVEKETGAPDERPRIACVFHNRLRRGMKLQTDPTVIYSILLRTGRYDGNIRRVDLDTPHPYNTYSVTGLPPGPIANPGQAALDAALHPLVCDDLFFVSKNDGSHVFCPTLKCHEENVEKWQRRFFRDQKRRAAQVHP